MTTFRFVAATSENEMRDGLIEAEKVEHVVNLLRSRGLCPIRIERPTKYFQLWQMLNRDLEMRAPLAAASLAGLAQEWAGLLEAGITVDESLALVGHGTSARTRALLWDVRDLVKSGLPLHEALSKYPSSFSAVFCALVRAGERAGTLAETLRRHADDLATRRALAEEIRNALVYPLFLVITATAGILVLLLIVVPSLENLTGDGGTERLSAMTRLVFFASRVVREHGFVALLSCASIFGVVAVSALTSRGRRWFDALLLKIPLLGPLVRTIDTARYARTFGGLLAGGVAAPAAMRVALDTVANRSIRTNLEEAHQSVASGSTIGEAIAASGAFADDAIGLIRVGERTGRLAETLARSATMNEARAGRQLKALTVMITPVLTIIFGAVTGVIVYAMLSTILGINELARP